MNANGMLLAVLVGLGGSCGCEPLTYSREAVVDFARYRSIAAVVNGGNQTYTSYLVQELDTVSGFEQVSSEPSKADVHLSVALDVEINTWIDSDGNVHVDYNGTASYVATDRDGVELLSGDTTDSSYSYGETAEDLLDEVAAQFMAPYRI